MDRNEENVWSGRCIRSRSLDVKTYGELPDIPEGQLPEEAKDLVVHANLRVGNTFLMLSDNFPNEPLERGSQITGAVLLNDAKKAHEVFEKLKQGGDIILPIQETSWSPAYGQVRDKYGITWQVSTVVE